MTEREYIGNFHYLGGHKLLSGDGKVYSGGCLPRASRLGQWFPVAGTDGSPPLLPESQWDGQESKRGYEWDDIDQGNTSSCCVCAASNTAELTIAINGGAQTKLDWLKAYRELTGGSGGVAVDEMLRYAQSKGIPTKDGQSVVKFAECWDAPSQPHFVSGVRAGCLGILCHDVHAECGVSVVMRNGIAYIDTRNSWGKDWGENGWHLFPASKIEVGTYGAFLLRSFVLRPIDMAA
jgi:hypothetical protein